MLALEVEPIVAVFTPAAQAASRATQRVPVVMWGVGDPEANGLVSNLGMPGGNITGTTALATELMAKNLELLRECLPLARRVAVLVHPTDPWTPVAAAALQRAAARLNFSLYMERSADVQSFPALFEAWSRQRMEALVVQPSVPTTAAGELALKHRLPACSVSRALVRAGGLFSCTPDTDEIHRHVARYVKRILEGARPARLPVLQSTRFHWLLNVGTARRLGLQIPVSLRLRADEVVA